MLNCSKQKVFDQSTIDGDKNDSKSDIEFSTIDRSGDRGNSYANGGGDRRLEVADDGDEEESFDNQKVYLPSKSERIISYLLCRKDLAQKKLQAKPVTLRELFRFADRPDLILIIIGTICAILSGITQPLIAVVSGQVTNVLLLQSPQKGTEFSSSAYQCVYLYAGIGCIALVMNYTKFMCFQTVCNRVITRMRREYIRSILRQNAAWFDHNQSGELTTRLNDNIDRIREGIGDKIGLLIRGLSMFMAALVIGFFYEWRLALVMVGVAPISCLIMAQLSQQMGSTTQKELQGVGKAGAIAEESILGVRTVQACNGQEEMVERYRTQLKRGLQHGVAKNYWSGILGGLFFFVLFVFLGGGLLYGGYLLYFGIIGDPGKVFVVVMSMLMGSYFLGVVSPHLMVLLNARVAAATIYQTIDRTPKIDVYSRVGIHPESVEGKVVFRDVHFRYPSRKDVKVLNGLNLTIEPGQRVALVGHSGCGKSTCVSLLARLYEPESGSVSIDGIDVRDLDIAWLRTTVSVVQQEPILFNDTIEANLKMGNPNADQRMMQRVCVMANAHEFITRLPNGYETRVGDGGVQLSGGQKQRIAIARTLIRNPRILLLDEATSALDTQSESIVQKALNNAVVGRTTIVIAHRLSTVMDADKIVVFKRGEIIEEGTHSELITLGGAYAQMVKAQQFQLDVDESSKIGSTYDELEIDDTADEVDTGSSQKTSARRISLSERRMSESSYIGQGEAEFTRAIAAEEKSVRSSNRISITGVEPLTPNPGAFAMTNDWDLAEATTSTAGFIDIYKNIDDHYLLVVIGLLSAMLAGLQLPAISMIFKFVFMAFQGEYDMQMIKQLYIAFGMCIGVGFGVWFTQNGCCGVVSENTIMSFRVRAFRNVLLQDASYFDDLSHAHGKLITRLASDAPNVKAALDSRMLQLIISFSAVGATLIIGFVGCWQVTLVGSSLSFLLGISQIMIAIWVYRQNMKLARDNEAGRLAVEIIEEVKTIQLLTRERNFFEIYQQASQRLRADESRKSWLEAINLTISQTFQYFMLAACYAIGISIIISGAKQASDVYNAIIAMLLGSVAIMNSAMYFPELMKAKSSAGLLFEMINQQPKTGNANEGNLWEIRGNLLFDNISFAYPRKPKQPVMNGLHFGASRGQTVALVGPSGSGKSTIISMLERFYDPSVGVVRFDGKDLRKMCLSHLRTQMALVGQEPRLFSGSIRQNVCFGLDWQPTTDDVNAALELANAKRFIDHLPQGIETEVGEKGTQLSGGQKQRIAIARAMIRNPKILLLDEATSALDTESERAVQEALDRASDGRTCITIAHRLSSIQNADVIIYIENGSVKETGTHSSLIARKGLYYDLIKKQNLEI